MLNKRVFVGWLLLGVLAWSGLVLAPPASAQELGEHRMERADRVQAFLDRRDQLLDHYATRMPADDYSRGGYADITAKLNRGVDLDWCAIRLDSLMQNPRGDMFWMYPVTTLMYAAQDKLPDSTWHQMRDLWRTYAPFRGDTENHWAMYYASLYLMAQLFPDDPAESWYTGKSSQENFDEAEEYLLSWMDLTTTIGQGEYDSPHYLLVYVAPMSMLYAFAEDPAMRTRAQMMLDYLLADFAAENLGGSYVGAHSRVYEREAVAPWRLGTTGLSWLAFGEGPEWMRHELVSFALSGYVPPAILHHIATDRSAPYVHVEGKRTRHRIRYSEVKNAPVYKYTYVRPEYALGSTQGGLLQPIQQQTWDLTWVPSDGAVMDARTTLFSVQPYSSPVELGMYFAEMQEFIVEIVVRSKTEYDSPDKLTGGSPYEQVFQHEDALVALYDIPEDNRFPHVNAFFSDELQDLTEDDSGWIFAHGGEALIAYYPFQPYTWEPVRDQIDTTRTHQRLYSPHLKNGAVVQVAPASAFDSFEAFMEAVRALPLEVSTDPTPSVTFTTLGGDVLAGTYGETPTIDGTPIDYENWPLYAGPFLRADQGSRQLEMRYGPMRRLLDFNTVTIKEWIEPAASTDLSQR
jgi:hypothetical protein